MKTQTVDLGPCTCPGKPHGRDSAEITRPEALEFGVLRCVWAARAIEVARVRVSGGGEVDGGLTQATLMAFATVSWTLTDERGQPVPIGLAHGAASLAAIDGLLPDVALPLADAFDVEPYQRLLFPAASPDVPPEVKPTAKLAGAAFARGVVQ